jgi:hypothetical protein
MKICQGNQSLIKIGKIYKKTDVRTYVRITVSSDTTLSYKRHLPAKWNQAVRLAGEVQTLSERATM